MNAKVTIDKAGRIVIPRAIREELHIEPGDSLELQAENKVVTLRVLHAASPLKKEHGVWVFCSGDKISAKDTAQVLKNIRQPRSFKSV